MRARFRFGAWLLAAVVAARLPGQTAPEAPAAPDPYAALRPAKAAVRVDVGGFVVADIDRDDVRYFSVGTGPGRGHSAGKGDL